MTSDHDPKDPFQTLITTTPSRTVTCTYTPLAPHPWAHFLHFLPTLPFPFLCFPSSLPLLTSRIWTFRNLDTHNPPSNHLHAPTLTPHPQSTFLANFNISTVEPLLTHRRRNPYYTITHTFFPRQIGKGGIIPIHLDRLTLWDLELSVSSQFWSQLLVTSFVPACPLNGMVLRPSLAYALSSLELFPSLLFLSLISTYHPYLSIAPSCKHLKI